MKLKIKTEIHCGRELNYPADVAGKAICELSHKKSFSTKDMLLLSAAGFCFEKLPKQEVKK